MIPDQWYAVLDSREVSGRRPRRFRRLGQDLVFWRDAKGEACAVEDRCPHRGAALSLGRIEGGNVQCPFHGFEFDGAGGCRCVPANGRTAPIPPTLHVRHVPVREAFGLVWIWSGEPRSDYPALPYFDDLDGFVTSTTQLAWDDVDYTRGVEGLLDLAHLPFVHRRTIGRGNETVVNGPYCTLEGGRLDVWYTNERESGKVALRPEEMKRPDFPPMIAFLFPNVWRLRISDKFFNVIVLAPVDEGRLVFYVRTCQKMVTVPLLGQVFAWLSNVLNVYIAQEDYEAIRSQRPVRSRPGGAEHLVPADRPIALYLRRRQELIDAAAGLALPAPADPPASPVALGRSLVVQRVVRETADALSFVLADPAGAPIAFEPGQYFTVQVPTTDGVLRRAYSASSAPGEHGGGVRLTVKKMEGGRASGSLHETLKEGDRLTVLGPSGSFGPSPGGGPRHLLMIAGGSGITPMMSLARSVLPKEPATRITLVYGSRDLPGVIFRQELDELAQAHPKRFTVVHVLDSPPEGWSGRRGPLTAAAVRELLDALDPGDEYLVCGPEPMMDAAVQALAASGVQSRRIRRESFAQQPQAIPRAREPQTVTLRHGGATRELIQSPGQTLLEAALSAGERVPYSCGIGACGTCKARLVSGHVQMPPSVNLSAVERNQGFVLQCVCHATEPVVVEVDGGK